MSYPWYSIVAGPTLEQGDFLRECLAPVVPRIAESVGQVSIDAPLGAPEPSDVFERVVILSQSCDLADGDIRRVMVCPIYTLADFLDRVGGSKEQQKSTKANLQRGRLTAHHLLNTCDLEGYEAPHLVVDFGDAFSVPLEYAVVLAGTGQRIRLSPPYREQLAQNFARFYMRVGLPIDVAKLP